MDGGGQRRPDRGIDAQHLLVQAMLPLQGRLVHRRARRVGLVDVLRAERFVGQRPPEREAAQGQDGGPARGQLLTARPLATISWVGDACGERRRARITKRKATASSQAWSIWSALVAGWMPTVIASASLDQPGLRSPATKGRMVKPCPSGGSARRAASSRAVGGRRRAVVAQANTLPPSLRAPPSSVSFAPTL